MASATLLSVTGSTGYSQTPTTTAILASRWLTTSVTMKARCVELFFRTVQDSLGFDPRAAFGIVPNSGSTCHSVSDAYAINEYSNGTLTNRSGSISGSTDPVRSQPTHLLT